MLESVLVAWRRATGFTIAALAMMCRDVHDLEFLVNLGNSENRLEQVHRTYALFEYTQIYYLKVFANRQAFFAKPCSSLVDVICRGVFPECFHNDAKRQRSAGEG